MLVGITINISAEVQTPYVLNSLDGFVTRTGCNIIGGEIVNNFTVYYTKFSFDACKYASSQAVDYLEIKENKQCWDAKGYWVGYSGKQYEFDNLCDVPVLKHILEYGHGSPRQQMKTGLESRNIFCPEEFKLIFKPVTADPACVKLDTATKLIGRGWIENPVKVIFLTDKTEYQKGQPISITMKNVGLVTLLTSSRPVGFSIFDDQGNRICSWIGGSMAVGSLPVGNEVTYVWNQQDCKKEKQVDTGVYVIIGDHFYPSRIHPAPTYRITITD